MYEIQIIPNDSEIIISFTGDVGYGEIGEVERRISSAMDLRPRRIILDCDGVTFADSSFLRMLLEVEKRAAGSAATMRIINVPITVSKIFLCTGLDAHFDWTMKIYGDSSDASASSGAATSLPV